MFPPEREQKRKLSGGKDDAYFMGPAGMRPRCRKDSLAMDHRIWNLLQHATLRRRIFMDTYRDKSPLTFHAVDLLPFHMFYFDSPNLLFQCTGTLAMKDYRFLTRPLYSDVKEFIDGTWMGFAAIRFAIGRAAEMQLYSMVPKTYIFDMTTVSMNQNCDQHNVSLRVDQMIRGKKMENIFQKELLFFPSFELEIDSYLTLITAPKNALHGPNDPSPAPRDKICHVFFYGTGGLTRYRQHVEPMIWFFLVRCAEVFEPASVANLEQIRIHFREIDIVQRYTFDKPLMIINIMLELLQKILYVDEAMEVFDSICEHTWRADSKNMHRFRKSLAERVHTIIESKQDLLIKYLLDMRDEICEKEFAKRRIIGDVIWLD